MAVVDQQLADTATATRSAPMLELRLRPAVDLSREQFFQLCQLNRDVRIERNAEGSIALMPPTGGETGARSGRLFAAVFGWADEDGTGVAFDSSTGFELPNGAIRSPDVAWVPRARLARVPEKDKQRFLPLCPDFVVELLSPSDSLPVLRGKMEEYRENGARLGWLIDPRRRSVTVYRPGASAEMFPQPTTVNGEGVVRGFVLNLGPIWESAF